MRAAAPFEMNLRIGLRERLVVSLWCGLSLAALAAWIVSHGWVMTRPDPMPAWVAALAASIAGAIAGLVAWVVSRSGWATLGWNRGAWLLIDPAPDAAARPGSLALMLDLGPWMLLRFQPDDRSACRWFGVDEAAAGAHWHALRAAVYRPVRNGQAHDGPADAAPP